METQDIDGSTLTANPEGHLRPNIPAGTAQANDKRFDKRRVLLVEESIERLAHPAQSELDPSIERCSPLRECLGRHSAASSELDSSHDRLANARGASEIELPPPTSEAEGTNSAAESNH